MAWAGTTPEGKNVPRCVEFDVKLRKGEECADAEPPELDFELEYLVGYLLEAGPTDGDKALTWTSIRAWRQETGAELDSFEAVAVKRMSAAYFNEQWAAKSPVCPNPATEGQPVTVEQKQAVNEQLRKGLTMLVEGSQRRGLGKAQKGVRKA